jgi:hypothetical protein
MPGAVGELWTSAKARLRRTWKDLTRTEVSGSLGDVGTLIPLLLALAKEKRIHLVPALFWAGLFNVIGGGSSEVDVKPGALVASVDSFCSNMFPTLRVSMGRSDASSAHEKH